MPTVNSDEVFYAVYLLAVLTGQPTLISNRGQQSSVPMSPNGPRALGISNGGLHPYYLSLLHLLWCRNLLLANIMIRLVITLRELQLLLQLTLSIGLVRSYGTFSLLLWELMN